MALLGSHLLSWQLPLFWEDFLHKFGICLSDCFIHLIYFPSSKSPSVRWEVTDSLQCSVGLRLKDLKVCNNKAIKKHALMDSLWNRRGLFIQTAPVKLDAQNGPKRLEKGMDNWPYLSHTLCNREVFSFYLDWWLINLSWQCIISLNRFSHSHR